LRLLADEAVLDDETVMGERGLVEQVAEAAVEGPLVALVGDLEHSVLHPESVREVLADGVAGDLRDPALEAMTVEQLLPFLTLRVTIGGSPSHRHQHRGRHEDHQRSLHLLLP
jgi:hypothetical protein